MRVCSRNAFSSFIFALLGHQPSCADRSTPSDLENQLRRQILLDPLSASLHGQLGVLCQENRRTLEAESAYRSAIKLDPKLAAAHVNLGTILEGKEAEESFQLAVEADPNLLAARYNLGIVRGKRLFNEGEWDMAEESFRMAIQADPSAAHAIEWGSERVSLARLLAHRGASDEAEAQWRVCAEALVKQGRSPVSAIINFAILGEAGWGAALEQERKWYKTVCQDGERRGILRLPGSGKKLPAALTALRKLENSVDWVVEYQRERVERFGLDLHLSGYGASWFQSWLAVAEDEWVAKSLGSMREVHDPGDKSSFTSDSPRVFVAGSGLGEHCLFAAALGASCIGYEMVCDSMVRRAQRLFKKHGVSALITLRCADATDVAAKDLDGVSLVWLNNLLWPAGVRQKLWKDLARKLPRGSVVVEPTETDLSEPEAEFARVGRAVAPFSWSTNQQINIFRKFAHPFHAQEL